MATPPEQEKYEVLETIGKVEVDAVLETLLMMLAGRGSFGVIRKVRRAADGHVRFAEHHFTRYR